MSGEELLRKAEDAGLDWKASSIGAYFGAYVARRSRE